MPSASASASASPAGTFKPPLFHPNIYPSGRVCLSLLVEDKDWKPTLSVKAVLSGIFDLLTSPNLEDPAQRDAYLLLRQDPKAYDAKVREQARKMAADLGGD
jgi:ubiquitin-conjugating enzyme E2 I